MSSMVHAAKCIALTSVLTAGCGSNTTNNPFRNFQIEDELDGHTYVYDFQESTGEVRYDPTLDVVIGVNRSTDGAFAVGYWGTPLSPVTFTITTAAVDTNGDGNFFDEDPIPLTGESAGTFSETGDELRLDLFLDPGLFDVDFGGTGRLVDIRENNP